MTDEEFLKRIMPDIEEYFLQNNRTVIIMQGYEWFREVITLYAKQHNLLEAAIVLMNNGMNEEALILARSAINNAFLIGYLLNDDSKRSSRLKEYHIQPLISQRYLLKNMKEMLEGSFGKRMKEKGMQLSFNLNDIRRKKLEIEKQIKSKGFPKDKKPLSILKLAKKSDKQGFDMYSTYYADASKFEHSDISSLDIYKRLIDEQTSTNTAFIMDLNRTDEKLKEKVYNIFLMSYLDSFIKIAGVIVNKETQLQVNYDMNKLAEITLKILARFK